MRERKSHITPNREVVFQKINMKLDTYAFGNIKTGKRIEDKKLGVCMWKRGRERERKREREKGEGGNKKAQLDAKNPRGGVNCKEGPGEKFGKKLHY